MTDALSQRRAGRMVAGKAALAAEKYGLLAFFLVLVAKIGRAHV